MRVMRVRAGMDFLEGMSLIGDLLTLELPSAEVVGMVLGSP